jgi:hypothetical protein
MTRKQEPWATAGQPSPSGTGSVYLLSSPVIDPAEVPLTILVQELAASEARKWLAPGFESAVGHASTASLLSRLLGMPVPQNRIAVKLRPGDKVVALKLEGRLPEGHVLSDEELGTVPFRLIGLDVRADPQTS